MKILKKLEPPTVIFDGRHIGQCFYLSQLHEKTEVAWLSTIKILKHDDATALIVDGELYIPTQEVSAATVEVDNWGDVINGLADDVDISTMRAWGHSHNDMPTNPSGQDRQHGLEFYESFGYAGGYFVSYIVNHHGEVHVDVYDWSEGVMHEDVPYSIDYWLSGEDEARLKAESEKRVKPLRYVQPSQTGLRNANPIQGYRQYPYNDSTQSSLPPPPQGTPESYLPPGRRHASYLTPLREEDGEFALPQGRQEQCDFLSDLGWVNDGPIWRPNDCSPQTLEVEAMLEEEGWVYLHHEDGYQRTEG